MKLHHTDAFTLKSELSCRKIALLPIGATEAHGPHLPCGTDSILAERLCEKLAEKIEAVTLPSIHYSQVWSLGKFSGSIGISFELLTKMITELLIDIHRNGFELIVIVNAHLGNLNAVKEATRAAYKQNSDINVMYFFYPGANKIIPQVMGQNLSEHGFFHADEIETSYMLHLAPEFVDMEKAVNEAPNIPELIDVTPIRWDEFTDTAVLGNAADATAEKGAAAIEYVIDEMVRLVGLKVSEA